MPSLRRLVWSVPVALAFAVSTAGAITPQATETDPAIDRMMNGTRVEHPELQRALSRGAAWSTFQSRYGAWHAVWNEVTKTPHRALGRAIPLAGFAGDDVSADRAVRTFIDQNSSVFGAPELQLAASYRARNVWYVHYRQLAGGVPLMNADWEFRVGSNGNLMAFGADRYVVPASVTSAPRIAQSVAREAAKSGVAFNPSTDRVLGGDLYVVPQRAANATSYHVAYRFSVVVTRPRETWTTLVDATSGEILQREASLRHAITGNVTGTVHPTLPTDTPIAKNLPNLLVHVGPISAYTDTSGNYSGDPGAGAWNVTAGINGRYCWVDRCVSNTCPINDASFAKSSSNPSVANIAWSSSNSQQSERDAYYHVNRAHDWVKAMDPTYTASDYPLETYIDGGDQDYCNAYWDFPTNTLTFLPSGGSPTCPNTATMPDIVYHEYGHSVSDNLYLAHGHANGVSNGALAEGLADAFCAMMTDDPQIGTGFFGPGTFLRDISLDKIWPQDRVSLSNHETGAILAGALWDLRQATGNAIASHIMFYAQYGLADDPDAGVAFNEYFVDALVADDNDNNLSNGTPHYAQIVNAFNAHGIGTNYNIDIAVTADDQANSGPFPITAVITYDGPVGALDPTSPQLFYSVNGTPFASTPMFPTGNPDEYGAQVPAQAFAVVHYYVRATTTDGGVKTVPAAAPTRYSSFVAGLYSTMFADDFENNLGWTVGASGDAATSGIWLRAAPVATPIQPGAAHSPSTCFVTGNGPAGDPAAADVDGGKTTLTSPQFDATAGGLVKPVISYWRWFSNNAGDSPSEDPWQVDISNDGGTNWVHVENTLETDESWRRVLFFIKDYVTPTNHMKLRFVAQDIVNPSLVEAALDDFTLYGFSPTVSVGDAPRGEFALAKSSPNPFRTATSIGYSLATRGHVDVSVYDIQGRTVRSLVSATEEAGAHHVTWDGRDSAGRPLPNGPYFVRLTQNGERASHAVVLMH